MQKLFKVVFYKQFISKLHNCAWTSFHAQFDLN